MILETLDVNEMTNFTATPQFSLGDQYFDNSTQTLYEYIQFDNGSGNVAAAANLPVGILKGQTSPFVVTTDYSDSATSTFRGILQAAITDKYYGWIARKGPTTAAITGSITSPAPLTWAADGVLAAAALDSSPTYPESYVVANILEDVTTSGTKIIDLL